MMDQRDSLAREIAEELRREQLLKLWEQYGTYMIAAAVLIIAGIGGFKYYEYSRTGAPETGGARHTARGKWQSPASRRRRGKPRRTRRPRRRRRWRKSRPRLLPAMRPSPACGS